MACLARRRAPWHGHLDVRPAVGDCVLNARAQLDGPIRELELVERPAEVRFSQPEFGPCATVRGNERPVSTHQYLGDCRTLENGVTQRVLPRPGQPRPHLLSAD